MQVQIQGDDGRELKPMETGEICVIGPGVFAGYYDNAEANAKAFRDGWFRTGDLGHMDEEGLSISPAAPPTCTSRADPTSIRARWRRRT